MQSTSLPKSPGLEARPENSSHAKRRYSRPAILSFLVVVIAAALGGVWLHAERTGSANAAGFGAIARAPAYMVVGTSTPVLFTTQILDPQLKKRSVILVRLDDVGKPSAILGRLRDEGRNGDVKAGDNVYSLRLNLAESEVGSVNFKVAARFKPGRWREPEPDDDDWDRELSTIAQTRRDHPVLRQLIARLLSRLFQRYSFSDVITVTVDPIPLPPDPGEAGKQTIEGIDSDHDGVRDDVERWIGITFPTSPDTRTAVTNVEKAFERFIVEGDNQERTIANDGEFTKRWNCLRSMRPDADEIINQLQLIVLDTGDRIIADDKANAQLHGTTLEPLIYGGSPASCFPQQ